MTSSSTLQLPLVLVDNRSLVSLNTPRNVVAKSRSALVTSSLNYDILSEIVQLKQMKESGAVIPELLRERFLLTYPKLLKRVDNESKRDLKRAEHSQRSIRSADQNVSKSLVQLPKTNPRLVQLAKPKKNLQKEFSDVERGEDFVPHMHDLSYHMSQLHDTRISATFQQKFDAAIRDLRSLLQILPFERTTEENGRIAEALVDMKSALLKHLPKRHLRQVASIATMDVFKEEDMTVFGNQGLFMVLKGTLNPLTLPVMRKKSDNVEDLFRQPTPTLTDPQEFTIDVGDCFGTLYSLPDRNVNSRVLSMMTTQPGVELMKISASAFDSLMKKLKASDHGEKLALLRTCPQYAQWPQLSLDEIASVMEWLQIPKGEMIVRENSVAPFIGIVASGTCNAYRTIDTMHKLSTGKRERRLKRMIIGELGEGSSFGEISVIEGLYSTCSILTSTPVHLAIITPESLRELNPVTVSLVQQSNMPTFGHVNSEWLKDEYIRTESTREWHQFRRQIVDACIREGQIHPGTGKWAKPPSQHEEARILSQKEDQ
ncbi:cyclic nucleotide-binding domain-containing protein 1-like [Convolutriloba macropyga]|uniref:cyclic nucleotide-binding domain-containing protein 1-like n=1 Tax=Convolutriloba macropyga TaxID=536237 RepID=UPI003F52493D